MQSNGAKPNKAMKVSIPIELRVRLNYLHTITSKNVAAIAEKAWVAYSTAWSAMNDPKRGISDMDTLARLVRGMGFHPAVLFIGPFASDEMPQYMEEKHIDAILPDSGGAERSYIHGKNRVADEQAIYGQAAFEEWKKAVPYFYCGRADGSSVMEQLLAGQMEEDRQNGVDRTQEMMRRIEKDSEIRYFEGYYVKPGTSEDDVPPPKQRKY